MMSAAAAAHYMPPPQTPFSFGSGAGQPLPPPSLTVPAVGLPPPHQQRPDVCLQSELPIEMTTVSIGGHHGLNHPGPAVQTQAHHHRAGGGQDLAPVSQPLHGDSPPPSSSSGMSPPSSCSSKSSSAAVKGKYVYGFSEQYAGSLSDGQKERPSPSPQATAEECFSTAETFKSYSVSQQFKSEVV